MSKQYKNPLCNAHTPPAGERGIYLYAQRYPVRQRNCQGNMPWKHVCTEAKTPAIYYMPLSMHI